MANILLIDDDVDLLNIIKSIVECSGHNITMANGVKEALKIIGSGKKEFALIFLDLQMPEYTGHDFLSLYTFIHEEKNTPIVILSSDKSEDAYKKAIEAGARDFIAKPVTNKVSLLRIIEKYIAG